jgi:hypothetical protein
VLQDALSLGEKQSFEACLGDSVRRHGGTYPDYVDLIARVRETARRLKTSLREAARVMAHQP